jgi:hypothetical protein
MKRRNSSTFSCDIAYSGNPAASRAASRSVKPCQRTTLPSPTVHPDQSGPQLISAPLCFSTPPEAGRDEHLVARVDELVEFDVGIVEFIPEPFHDPPESLTPPLHAPEVGAEGRVMHVLKLRWRVREREHGVEVGSVERLVNPPKQLHVLLRHRPSSIRFGSLLVKGTRILSPPLAV